MKFKYNQLVKKFGSYVVIVFAFLFFFAGFSYTFGIATHHIYSATTMIVPCEDDKWMIHVNFASSDGFFSQTPITVNINATEKQRRSNFTVLGVFIRDAFVVEEVNREMVRTQQLYNNMSGILIEEEHFEATESSNNENQYYRYVNSRDVSRDVEFPFEGDYEAFVIFDTPNDTQQISVPIGRIIHVSSPESAIQFKTNNIVTGLTLIVTGMTIFQIWISLRQRKL